MKYKVIGWESDCSNDVDCLIICVDNEIDAQNVAINLTPSKTCTPPIEVKAQGEKVVISVSRKAKVNKERIENDFCALIRSLN